MLAVVHFLTRYGRPCRMTFDRDSRWVGSHSLRQFPSAFCRFLLCLGIQPNTYPPRRPDKSNDLEHCFGVTRAHERRATGRRGAIPGVVVRGSVRLMAVVVTQHEDLQAADLQPSDYLAWRQLRAQLWYLQEARRQQWRSCKNPAAYLAALEAQLLE